MNESAATVVSSEGSGRSIYSAWEDFECVRFYGELSEKAPEESSTDDGNDSVGETDEWARDSIPSYPKKIIEVEGQPQNKHYSLSKKDICKKARNSGKPYVKLKGKDKGAFVGEKEIGPDCLCPNKCYDKVGRETIRKIFRDFWALGDYNSQNAYLFGLINLLGVKRRYTKKEVSRRNFTIVYSVKRRGENVNVCKKAFLSIHGLQRNRGRINNLANKMKEGESVPPPDRRGRHSNRPNAYSEEAILHVKNHLTQCPKLERRRNPSKPSKQMEYSLKRCYDLYVAVYCKEKDLLPVSKDKYRRIYWEEGYRYSQSTEKHAEGNVIPSDVTIRKLSS